MKFIEGRYYTVGSHGVCQYMVIDDVNIDFSWHRFKGSDGFIFTMTNDSLNKVEVYYSLLDNVKARLSLSKQGPE